MCLTNVLSLLQLNSDLQPFMKRGMGEPMLFSMTAAPVIFHRQIVGQERWHQQLQQVQEASSLTPLQELNVLLFWNVTGNPDMFCTLMCRWCKLNFSLTDSRNLVNGWPWNCLFCFLHCSSVFVSHEDIHLLGLCKIAAGFKMKDFIIINIPDLARPVVEMRPFDFYLELFEIWPQTWSF